MENYERRGEAEKTLMEKILTIFPGYSGYRKKEVLRETDRLIRDTIFAELRKTKDKFDRYQRSLASAGQSEAKYAERLSMRMDATSEKIHHATYGYAPELNVIQIKEDHIGRLTEFDAKLSEKLAVLRGQIDGLGSCETGALQKLLADIEQILTDLGDTFSDRNNFMMGLGGRE